MGSDYVTLIVEISVTVYAFLLGFPMLVFQIFLPDELRSISKKNYTDDLWKRLMKMTGLLLVITFTAFPLETFLFPGATIPHDENDFYYEYVQIVLITILFIFMVYETISILKPHLKNSQGYRSRIVEVIKEKIIKEYQQDQKVDPAFLDDMEYLGTYSKAGTETQIVIEALEEMLRIIKAEEEVGSESDILATIIDTLCLSVTNSMDSGNRQNMEEVLSIYTQILMDLQKHSTAEKPLINSNEARKIKDCTTKIALMALKKDYPEIMPRALNVLKLIPGSQDKLFEIGLIALGRNQNQIATNVLSVIISSEERHYSMMNNYLGLIAHFYFAGKTARNYALRSLKNNRIEISPKELTSAEEYHNILSNFQTADKIHDFANSLFSKKVKQKTR